MPVRAQAHFLPGEVVAHEDVTSALRFGETATEGPELFERDLNLRAGVDEVIVIAAGTVGDCAKAHHGAGDSAALTLPV